MAKAGEKLRQMSSKRQLGTEKKYGQARRVWVFDRGVVSEKNLQLLRQCGEFYLVRRRSR